MSNDVEALPGATSSDVTRDSSSRLVSTSGAPTSLTHAGQVLAGARRSGAADQVENIDFLRRKEQILVALDRSPKGSLDAPILDLLSWLNSCPAVVTTSSCSGRIAVFQGASDPVSAKGGRWLFSSHEVVTDGDAAWNQIVQGLEQQREGTDGAQGTMVTFLHEPFVLHAECGDVQTAQSMLTVARGVGMRESGLSVGRRVLVQLRALALRLEAPLALDGSVVVDRSYFDVLLRLANARLAENAARISKLWAALRDSLVAGALEDPSAGMVPWVLGCPQSAARGIKLALEQRGWMDEGRKMAAFCESGQIGLPVLEAAAALLEIPRCETLPGGVATAPADLLGEVHEVDKKRAGRPSRADKVARAAAAAHPADLEALWRCGVQGAPLILVRSDALPRKQCPPQRTFAEDEREVVVRSVREAHSRVTEVTNESPDIEILIRDVRSASAFQWRGDVALLPRGALEGPEWRQFALVSIDVWELIRAAISARLLARQQEILVGDGTRGGAVEILAGQGDGWVVVQGPRNVKYTYDVTKCMFSEGNAGEKERVAGWCVEGETVLDMYTGIGFWTLPLLAAGAKHVISCEWNPNAVEGLRRGLELLGQDSVARCTVMEGDNRREEVHSMVVGRCDRVMLGLIPTSREGFPNAAAALREAGGVMHVHWNVGEDEAGDVGEVVSELEGVLRATRGEEWRCILQHVQRIKWFAPRVRHVRIDVRCEGSAVA